MTTLQIFEAYSAYAYPILFILMFIEGGDATLLASGFLIRLGILKFYIAFPLALIGAFLRDVILYEVGDRYGENFIDQYGKFFFVTPECFRKIEDRLMNSKGKTVFASKFLYGLNHITIVAIGAIKMDFKRFLKIDSMTIFLWGSLMVGLGFLFGHSFTLVRHYVRDVSVFLLMVLAIFFLFEALIRAKIKITNNNGR